MNTLATCIAHGQPSLCDHEGPFQFCLRPEQLPDVLLPVTFESIFNPALKWNHSALTEPDFVDEWMAADIAFHLAHEIASNPTSSLHANASDAAIADVPHGRTSQSVQYFSNTDLYKDFAGFFLPHAFAPVDVHTDPRDDAVQVKVHLVRHGLQSALQQHPNTPVPFRCEDSGPCLKPGDEPVLHMPQEVLRERSMQSKDSACLIQHGIASPNYPLPILKSSIPGEIKHAAKARTVASHVSHDQAFQSGVSSFLGHLQSHTNAQPATPSMVDPIPFCPAVKFCTEVDLYIGCEDQWKFHHIRIPEDSLVMQSKPWSLAPSENMSPDCRMCCTMSSTRNTTQAHDSRLYSGVFSHDESFMSRLPDQSIGTDVPRRQVVFSQSQPAQKHSESFLEERIQAGLPSELVLQCRLEHESPIGWLPPNDEQDEDENPNDPTPPNFDEEPALVRHLRSKFSQLGFTNFDGDFEVPIRTWYLDHVNVRRWTAPRILQLVGPPTHGSSNSFHYG